MSENNNQTDHLEASEPIECDLSRGNDLYEHLCLDGVPPQRSYKHDHEPHPQRERMNAYEKNIRTNYEKEKYFSDEQYDQKSNTTDKEDKKLINVKSIVDRLVKAEEQSKGY